MESRCLPVFTQFLRKRRIPFADCTGSAVAVRSSVSVTSSTSSVKHLSSRTGQSAVSSRNIEYIVFFAGLLRRDGAVSFLLQSAFLVSMYFVVGKGYTTVT